MKLRFNPWIPSMQGTVGSDWYIKQKTRDSRNCFQLQAGKYSLKLRFKGSNLLGYTGRTTIGRICPSCSVNLPIKVHKFADAIF